MELIRSIDRAIVRLELCVALVAMSGVVVILSLQVFFRYVLQSPLFYAEELALALLIVATFAGLSLAVGENRLIGVALFDAVLSSNARAWMAWGMCAAGIAVTGALAVYGYRYIAVPWVWNERFATLPLPRAALYSFVTAELFAMTFHQLVRLLDTMPARKPEVTP